MLMESEGMDTDVAWVLHKMLPGQRTSAAGWVAKAAKTLVAMDFERCPQQPQFFFRLADNVLIEVHVNDFHGTGGREGAELAVAAPRDALDLKASDVIAHGRYSHLKRDRMKLSGETLIRPDPRSLHQESDRLHGHEGREGLAEPVAGPQRPGGRDDHRGQDGGQQVQGCGRPLAPHQR